MRAPRCAATPCSSGVPSRGLGQPRRGQHLDERVRQLVAPHERAPQRVLDRPEPPHQQPLHRRRHGAAAATPAASSSGAASSAATANPAAACDRHQQACDEHGERDGAHHRHHPAQLDQQRGRPAAAAAGRRCGSVSRCSTARRSCIGGMPSHDEPVFAFFGVADSTPTRPSVGHRAARRGHPGVAEEGPLADRARARRASSRRAARRARPSCRRRGTRRRRPWSSWAARARSTPPRRGRPSRRAAAATRA